MFRIEKAIFNSFTQLGSLYLIQKVIWLNGELTIVAIYFSDCYLLHFTPSFGFFSIICAYSKPDMIKFVPFQRKQRSEENSHYLENQIR